MRLKVLEATLAKRTWRSHVYIVHNPYHCTERKKPPSSTVIASASLCQGTEKVGPWCNTAVSPGSSGWSGCTRPSHVSSSTTIAGPACRGPNKPQTEKTLISQSPGRAGGSPRAAPCPLACEPPARLGFGLAFGRGLLATPAGGKRQHREPTHICTTGPGRSRR